MLSLAVGMVLDRNSPNKTLEWCLDKAAWGLCFPCLRQHQKEPRWSCLGGWTGCFHRFGLFSAPLTVCISQMFKSFLQSVMLLLRGAFFPKKSLCTLRKLSLTPLHWRLERILEFRICFFPILRVQLPKKSVKEEPDCPYTMNTEVNKLLTLFNIFLSVLNNTFPATPATAFNLGRSKTILKKMYENRTQCRNFWGERYHCQVKSKCF